VCLKEVHELVLNKVSAHCSLRQWLKINNLLNMTFPMYVITCKAYNLTRAYHCNSYIFSQWNKLNTVTLTSSCHPHHYILNCQNVANHTAASVQTSCQNVAHHTAAPIETCCQNAANHTAAPVWTYPVKMLQIILLHLSEPVLSKYCKSYCCIC
jgi:hypothetical protein